MNKLTKVAGIFMGAAIAGEGLLYGITEAIPDWYLDFFPTTCTPARQGASAFQKLFLATPEKQSVVTALGTDDAGVFHQRTFIVDTDAAERAQICGSSAPSTLPKFHIVCDFEEVQGQYIGGVLSPRVPSGGLSCRPPSANAQNEIIELTRTKTPDKGFVFHFYDPCSFSGC